MPKIDSAVDAAVRDIFYKAKFIKLLGLKITELEHGICKTELVLQPEHLQQTGSAHAGVTATMADHTAGGAATTVLPVTHFVLTTEFKINFLRVAEGPRLTCIAKVLKSGKTIGVVESEVYSASKNGEVLVAKALLSMAVLEKREA